MLTVQAHTLDAIFNKLAQMALSQEWFDNFQALLKLSFRAQSQCRVTWEALSTMKNPPVVGFVKQANIAHGHQQVNNHATPEQHAPRAQKSDNSPNELLEQTDGERLDAGATSTSGQADPAMATVGAIDGAEDD